MHQTQPFQLVLQPVDGGFDIVDLQRQLLFSYHDFKTRLSNDARPLHKHAGGIGAVQGIPERAIDGLQPEVL